MTHRDISGNVEHNEKKKRESSIKKTDYNSTSSPIKMVYWNVVEEFKEIIQSTFLTPQPSPESWSNKLMKRHYMGESA